MKPMKLTHQERHFRELVQTVQQLEGMLRSSVPPSLDLIPWRLRLSELRTRFDQVIDLLPRPTEWEEN